MSWVILFLLVVGVGWLLRLVYERRRRHRLLTEIRDALTASPAPARNRRPQARGCRSVSIQ